MCPITIIIFLFVNSLVEKLTGVEVESRGWMVTALLYADDADDAVLLAENEEQVKRGLKVLEEWCRVSGGS